ncbi:MAG: beta-ketoacyl-[acyl-carrier-protein] synthase family protein [Bryobacteraceae bacterium]
MSEPGVVVTGLGAVSAFGVGVSRFWDALAHGRSGIRPITAPLPAALRFSNGAEVCGYVANDHFDEKQLSLMDRFAQYAVVAAREAVHDSGLVFDKRRTAIVTGSSAGGQDSSDAGFDDLYKKGSPRVNPMMIPRVMTSGGASWISMELGIQGPVYSVSTACSSANHAIGQAFWMIRNGVCDAAIAGGCDAVFSYGFLKAWEAMRVVSVDTCRPFSSGRRGLILGEGAAMLILERTDAARARGARIYAELAGFGMSSDAHHITQPSAEGAALAMSAALKDGGLATEAIGYINAHGTGTEANDAMETTAIRQTFGGHADRLQVSSTKSMHGHALGAAGALEAVATALSLRHGILPPTANYLESDPACDLDVIPNEPRYRQVGAALSNSFAFGGLNAVLAFRAVANCSFTPRSPERYADAVNPPSLFSKAY